MTISNFGVILKKGTNPVGKVLSIEPPEVINEPVEVTNHSSTYREFISSKLVEVSEFKVSVAFESATISGLLNDLVNGTSASYTIEFPNNEGSWTFNAFCTGLKPTEADAQNPEVLKAEVTFRPTGTLTR